MGIAPIIPWIAAIGLMACAPRPFGTYVGESNFSSRPVGFFRPGSSGFSTLKIPLPSCRDTLQIRTWVREATRQAECGWDWIRYDTPANGVYELANDFYSGDSLSFSVLGFELRYRDSLLFAKAYPPQERWMSNTGQAYCDRDSCRRSLDKRDSIPPCPRDSILALPTAGAFRLPVVDRILLRERLRIKNRACDTVVVVEEGMEFGKGGGISLKFERDPHCRKIPWWVR